MDSRMVSNQVFQINQTCECGRIKFFKGICDWRDSEQSNMVVCESQSIKSVESVCDRRNSRMANRLEAICNSQNQLIVESDMVNITAESVSRIANLWIKSVESCNSRMSNFLGSILNHSMESGNWWKFKLSKSVGQVNISQGIKSKSGPRVTQCGRISLWSQDWREWNQIFQISFWLAWLTDGKTVSDWNL